MLLRMILISAVFLIAMVCLYRRFVRLSRAASETAAVKQPHFSYYEAVILFLSIYLQLMISIQTSLGDPIYFSTTLRDMADGTYHFSGLYSGGGINYPPLFQYLAFVWAKILNAFHIPLGPEYPICIFCIKLPGMLCVFLMAILICRLAAGKQEVSSFLPADETRQTGMQVAALAMILLNPGCIFIASYITQVDGIYTFFVLLTVCLLYKRRLKIAFFVFAAAIMIKFQAVFITPVVACAVIHQDCLEGFSRKKFGRDLAAGLGAIACMGLAYLPFIWNARTNAVANGGIMINFTSAVKSFGWATQNTYNFWALVGYNWRQSYEMFGWMSCDRWGTLFIILVVLLSGFLFFRIRGDKRDAYPMIGALMVSGIILFSVKMMPRYLFPAIVLLILGFAVRPCLQRLLCVLLFSVYFFLILTCDYIVYPVSKFSRDLIPPYIIAAYGLFCFGFLIYTIWKMKVKEL